MLENSRKKGKTTAAKFAQWSRVKASIIRASSSSLIHRLTLGASIDKLETKLTRARREKEAAIDAAPPLVGEEQSLEEMMAHFEKLSAEGNPEIQKAVHLRNQEKEIITELVRVRLYRRSLLIASTIAAGKILELLLPTMGKNVGIEYFSALTQIYPVLVIAAYLSNVPLRDNEFTRQSNFLDARFAGIMMAALGEIYSLVILATGKSTTNALVVTFITTIYMFRVIFETVIKRQ